jgi:hypothetical protein
MNSQMQFVRDLAELCDRYGFHLSAAELATLLNRARINTTYGTTYAGRRGTYRLVKQTHGRLTRLGRAKEAAMVARTFTRPNGRYAY